MPILMKIVLGIGAVVLIIGSTLVTIAALFPPQEYKGEGKAGENIWDELIWEVQASYRSH